MNKILLSLFCILLSATFCALSLVQMNLNETSAAKFESEQEILYLPNKDGVKFLSFGYNNLLSDLLWFKTISYFGKHHSTDQNYPWLSHMCSLVTDLNPYAKHVYQFCSTMLSWESNQPAESLKILTKAIKDNPKDWFFYYLRGFTHYYFLNDSKSAQEDFVTASKLPDAHPLVRRLAAKQLAQEDPGASIEFLTQMLEMTEDPQQRETLEEKLREIAYERDARKLEEAVSFYKQKTGKDAKSLEDLVNLGIIPPTLNDPYGGLYTLDASTGQVLSSTGKKRKTRKGD